MNRELSRCISKLVKLDQGIRNSELSDSKLLGGLHGYIVYLIDGIHNWRIHRLMKEYGYLTQKLIGRRGMRDFWLLVQHQDFDLELQKACLKHCDFEPREKAYLTDRTLVNAGEKQLYGTQFYRDKRGVLVPYPIKDKKNLDKRRKEVGLESFQKYAEEMKKKSRNPKTKAS